MPETILHHYQLSPYYGEIRLALGLKGLSWALRLKIPVWTPRPKLTPMTGGYRRTPILQIGAEFYCDTLLILRVIEELGSSEEPFILRARRNGEGAVLVDREELVHERGLPDDRNMAGKAASGADQRASAAVRR